MNETEARKLLSGKKIEDVSASLSWAGSNSDGHWCIAKGYLEAIDKAKILEDYVRSQVTSVAGHLAKDHRPGFHCQLCKPKEILDQWEKEK